MISNKSKKDTPLHTAVLAGAKFKRTPAEVLSLERFKKLGLTEAEAKAVLKRL